jgi:hypothetical protein
MIGPVAEAVPRAGWDFPEIDVADDSLRLIGKLATRASTAGKHGRG